MPTQCSYCGFVDLETPKGYIQKFCNKCIKPKPFTGFPYFKETVKLKNYEKPVSRARLSELHSQTHIAGKTKDEYYIGRKLKNGKIQEKSPDPSN